ncbi:cytidylate kinase family protein [Candidatus Woesearchaeota archaeon]|nr:cytidylate kinase family protein [Candidatus Woesearchaeota archaeon]
MIIAIGGSAGGGKTSVANALARKLGYKRYSGGDMMRSFAHEQGITLEELHQQAKSDPNFDRQVDEQLKRIGEKEDNFVIDSRLGFFFIPHSIKIYLDAELKIRAKRTMEKARFEECPEDLKEAMRLLEKRAENDAARYEKLYGVNPFEHEHYDLVIDTSKNTVEQTTEQIYRFIKSKVG